MKNNSWDQKQFAVALSDIDDINTRMNALSKYLDRDIPLDPTDAAELHRQLEYVAEYAETLRERAAFRLVGLPA